MERAVCARVATACSKWQEIASLLENKRIPLKNYAHVYTAFINLVLVFGAESWPFTQRPKNDIRSCYRRMLRFMAGVSLRDRVNSTEEARRCGLKEIFDMACVKRL